MKYPYNDFGSWMRQQFPYKVQKISIDAGFTALQETAQRASAAAPIATIGASIQPIVATNAR